MRIVELVVFSAGLLALAIYGAIVLAVRGPLAEIVVRADEIAIRPLGINRLWAAARSVRVPRSAIAAAHVEDEPGEITRGIRRRGAWLPGILTAGFYGSGWHRSYWLAKPHRPAVVLDLAWTLRRIVVDVADADRVVAALNVR